jgi:hypothetical protein
VLVGASGHDADVEITGNLVMNRYGAGQPARSDWLESTRAPADSWGWVGFDFSLSAVEHGA